MGEKELKQWNSFADDITKEHKDNCFFSNIMGDWLFVWGNENKSINLSYEEYETFKQLLKERGVKFETRI